MGREKGMVEKDQGSLRCGRHRVSLPGWPFLDDLGWFTLKAKRLGPRQSRGSGGSWEAAKKPPCRLTGKGANELLNQIRKERQ